MAKATLENTSPSFEHEDELRRTHQCQKVAGIDEAGRGPLAGPVFAAAVIIPEGYQTEWLFMLNDSKKLTEKKRELLYPLITEDPEIIWSIAQASEKEIDDINILKATHLAMARAAQTLSTTPAHCLIDGRPVPNFPLPSTGLVKGDSKSYSIAAASILAKVARDHLMMEIAKQYPQYSFHKHKGYGTKVHLEALEAHGPCNHHRLSFSPVQRALGNADL